MAKTSRLRALAALVRAARRELLPPAPGERLAGIVPAGKGTTLNKQVGDNPTATPALKGGRQTQPSNFNPLGLTTYAFLWRKDYQSIDLATLDLEDYEPGQLLSLLADLSPDVSLAVWNVLRMAGTGLTLHAVTPAGADSTEGQAYIDALLPRLGREAGGFGGVVTQLLLTAYLQGALALDVAPTPLLDDVEDLYPVNPSTIYFQRDETQAIVPFQRQIMTWGSGVVPFRRLNTELFTYTPIDPYVDDPYGRAPTTPILQVVFFWIQVMRDLQRVIHAQGWPKIDISVVGKVLEESMPQSVKNDQRAKAAWTTARQNEILAAYNGMSPEDAFIHPDYVEVNGNNAAAGARLFDVSAVLGAIRSQAIAALKQLPVLMGMHVGSTETYSTIELTIFARSIDTFREPTGALLARACTIACQLAGIPAIVEPSWESLEVYDPLTRAKTLAQEQANAAYQRDQNWIDQDQASELITGSKAVGPAPAPMSPDPGPDGEDTKPSNP